MWSRKHERCICCSATDYKHMAGGKCSQCYLKEYTAKNKARCDEQKANWYRKNITKEAQKETRSQMYFGGLREQVIERDGCCTKCGVTEDLVVHHRDRQGRGEKVPNNDLDNLQTLCRSCHMIEHAQELAASRMKTSCKKGHRYIENGTYNGRQWVCRICAAEKARAAREAKKGLNV